MHQTRNSCLFVLDMSMMMKISVLIVNYGSVECGSRKPEGISQRVISCRFFLI